MASGTSGAGRGRPSSSASRGKQGGRATSAAKATKSVKSTPSVKAAAPRTAASGSAAKGTKGAKPSSAPVPAPLAERFHRYALPRVGDGVRHWLFKTEPEVFSFDDLLAAPRQTTYWDGVRNFQVRNFMRDHMRVGDLVFIYHSNAEPPSIVGIARVARAAYPDHTAFDAADAHYDPKSDPAAPTWMMVDVQAVCALQPVALPTLREVAGLEAMELLQRGSRLSITPLTAAEWAIVERLGRAT